MHHAIKSCLRHFILLLPILVSGEVVADDVGELFEFDGFASFVYAKALDSDEGSVGGIGQEGEYRDLNRLGFRMYSDFGDGLAFTAQLTANGSDDYDPEIDQLFIDIDLLANVQLTIGKFRPPIFLYSDVLDVGYAYPWITPPDVVYDPDLNPFKSLEGFKLKYLAEMGPYWTSELVLFLGDSRDPFVVSDVGLDSELVVDDGYGLSWSVSHKWLTLRALYFVADTSTDITTNEDVSELIFGADLDNPADGAVEAIELLVGNTLGQTVNFRDNFLWEQDPSKYLGLGMMLDFERYFVISEATRIDVDTNVAAPRQDSYYATIGRRFPGDWSLFLTYGVDNNTATEEVWTQFDPYIGADGLLGGALDNILIVARDTTRETVKNLQDFDIKYLNYGVRWNVYPSTSLKFELLTREYRNFESDQGSKVEREPSAIRIALDLVF